MAGAPSGERGHSLARPVPVELDAVAVRVAQVDRLADAVIRGAVEWDAGREDPADSAPASACRVGYRMATW